MQVSQLPGIPQSPMTIVETSDDGMTSVDKQFPQLGRLCGDEGSDKVANMQLVDTLLFCVSSEGSDSLTDCNVQPEILL